MSEIISKPNYNLGDAQMNVLEWSVVEYARKSYPDKNVVGIIAPSYSRVANFGRTGEQRTFDGLGEEYDFETGMGGYEDKSEFLFTVDTAQGCIAHIKRLVWPLGEVTIDSEQTGIEPIDDRINATDSEEHMTLREILENSGISIDELKKAFNVATNFNTKRAAAIKPIAHSLLSYYLTFVYAMEKNAPFITAYLNRSARLSLGGFGVEYTLLGGKPFHLPKTDGKSYDVGYEAVLIPDSENNKKLFIKLGELAGVPLLPYEES